MPNLTDRDIAALTWQTPETLIAWWQQLNRWQWPDGLPDPEPASLPQSGESCSQIRGWQIMCWIERRVGLKALLRHWNAGMTEPEFEEFWQSVHGERR